MMTLRFWSGWKTWRGPEDELGPADEITRKYVDAIHSTAPLIFRQACALEAILAELKGEIDIGELLRPCNRASKMFQSF